MKLRYAGICRLCAVTLPARSEAIYEGGTKTVRCIECTSSGQRADVTAVETEPRGVTADSSPDSGTAGASARREYERRKARDEERLRRKWGRLGGIAVALSEEKQNTKAWATGAGGEERLGSRLDTLASVDFAAIHDKRVPGFRTNIDDIGVTRAGICVIDAKRYKGQVELEVEGGLLRPRIGKLMVGRRDCTKLIDSARIHHQ